MKKWISMATAVIILSTLTVASPTTQRPTLQLRLFGNYGKLPSGDLAEDIKSHDRIYRDLAEIEGGGTLSGGHEPSRQGFGGGVDLLLGLSDRFSLGLGFEHLRKSKTDNQDLRTDLDEKSFQAVERSIRHHLATTGILLKLNYRLPLSQSVSLFADLGAGLYITSVDHDLNWTGNYEFWGVGRYLDSTGVRQNGWFKYLYGNWTQSDLITFTKSKIGWTGGLGIEFSVSKTIGLFIEGKARFLKWESPLAEESFDFHETYQETAILADLRNWKTYETREAWEKEGPLSIYDFSSADTKKTYAFATANAEELEKDADNSNFRSAVINLNGLEVRLGIRIRVF